MRLPQLVQRRPKYDAGLGIVIVLRLEQEYRDADAPHGLHEALLQEAVGLPRLGAPREVHRGPVAGVRLGAKYGLDPTVRAAHHDRATRVNERERLQVGKPGELIL